MGKPLKPRLLALGGAIIPPPSRPHPLIWLYVTSGRLAADGILVGWRWAQALRCNLNQITGVQK